MATVKGDPVGPATDISASVAEHPDVYWWASTSPIIAGLVLVSVSAALVWRNRRQVAGSSTDTEQDDRDVPQGLAIIAAGLVALGAAGHLALAFPSLLDPLPTP